MATGRLPALDGVRAVAIMLVLATHGGWLRGGSAGVSLFFALSGYLITSLLVAEYDCNGEIALRKFYWRRFWRLGPALVVALVGLAVCTWLRTQTIPGALIVGELTVLLYVSNFAMGLAYPRLQIDAVQWGWSLSLEEQFYLLWPPLLTKTLGRVSRTRLALVAIGAALLLTAARAVVLPHHGLACYYLIRGDEIMLGSAAALLPRLRVPRWAALAAAALFVGVMQSTSPRVYDLGMLLLGVSSAALVVAVARSGFLHWLLASPPMVHLGRISYALYLWNYTMLWFNPWPRSPVVWLFLSVALAETSTWFVERPLRRWAAARKATPVRPSPATAVADPA